MARKIKFALEMADGTKVRSNLEELREHFDLESIMGYFLSGKLQEWLEDRYYEKEADEIANLNKDDTEIRTKLCKIFDIEPPETDELNINSIEIINKKKAMLRQVTDDETIIEHVQQVAFNQEELAKLIECEEEIIYLCGKEFTIPAKVDNKTYIGVNNPQIYINVKSVQELSDNKIIFKNVKLADKLSSLIKKTNEENNINDEIQALSVYERTKNLYGFNEAEAEKFFMEHDYKKAIKYFIKASKETERAYYFLSFFYRDGYGTPIDINKSNKYKELGDKSEDVIAKCSNIDSYLKETGDLDAAIDKIFPKLKEEANKGDPFACHELAHMFLREYNNINYETAENYAYKSAKFGNYAALVMLGHIAYKLEDYSKTVDLVYKAQKAGYPLAFDWLGAMYELGKGVEKNLRKAFQYYELGAKKGLPNLQNKVGNMYYWGNGINQDYEKACYWYEKACKNNQPDAHNSLGIMYVNGYGVEQDYKQACYWYEKGSRLGNSWAQYNLAYNYYHGYAYDGDIGPLQDYKKAIKYFKLSAKQDNKSAMYYLGECYRHGYGVKINMDTAHDWYVKAADENDDAKAILDDWDNIMTEYNQSAWMRNLSMEERQSICDEIDKSIKMTREALEDLERSPFERFMKKFF